MILKNISVLYGTNLQFKEKTNVQVTKDVYKTISPKITSRNTKIINCEGLLLIPG